MNMANRKILFVLTNHGKLGSTDRKTGWYLPECAHPYYELTAKQSYKVEFCSPIGGACPIDEQSLTFPECDELCRMFYNDAGIQSRINSSVAANEVDLDKYDAVFYVGGHGPMWDVIHCKPLADKVAAWYTKSLKENAHLGVIGAVCHGPAGLVNVTIDGHPFVEGACMTCFSNSEEEAVKLATLVPFLLENRLKERGATVEVGPDWKEKVVVHREKRLVTGQNPASAAATARAMLNLMETPTTAGEVKQQGQTHETEGTQPDQRSRAKTATGQETGEMSF